MSSPHPLLRIEAADQPDSYVIRVEGDLDLPGCPDLESALADAERSRARRIVLDLDRLGSIDARGLQILLGVSRHSARNGNRLRLTRGTGDVARMLRLTMLDLTLAFTDPVGPQASAAAPERVGS